MSKFSLYCSINSLAFASFVLILSSYGLLIGEKFYSSDGQTMYETGRSLAFEGTIALDEDFGLPQIRQYSDGNYYGQYDLGLPLLAAPIIRASDALAKAHLVNRYGFSAYGVIWLSVLTVAGGLVALFRCSINLGYSSYASIIGILTVAYATPVFVYGRLFFAEGLLAGLLCVVLWGIGQGKNIVETEPASLLLDGWWLLFAGAIFGLAIFTRAAMLIYLPAWLWLIWRWYPRNIRAFSLFLAGASGGILGILAHNIWRSGNPFTFGYGGQGFTTAPWEGIAGLLISPDKSIFLFAPTLAISFWQWRAFHKKHAAIAETLAIMAITALVFYGSWWAWEGGASWGPRFLVPLIPLWHLPFIDWWSENVGKTWLALPLRAWGFFVNLSGVLTDVNHHYTRIGDVDMVDYALTDSAIYGAVLSLSRGEVDALRTLQLTELGWLLLPSTLFPLLLAIAAIVSIGFITRNSSKAEKLYDKTSKRLHYSHDDTSGT